jgi:hypothetical protein
MANRISTDPTVLSSARWFWWIAGLSLVNTILFHAGSDTSFVLGLAMTTIASVVFSGNLAVAMGLAGLMIAFYFLMGWQAQREKAWAFYLGLTVYVVDALIYVKFQDWMSVGFHCFAIFYIIKGALRLRELARLPAPATAAEA